MKTRSGFVSNSSSSSFIIGAGLLCTQEEIKKAKELCNVDVYPLMDLVDGTVYNNTRGWNSEGYKPDTDTLTLESFTGTTVTVEGIREEWVKNPYACVAVLDGCGGDDDDFSVYDDDGDFSHYDYDVDYEDHFPDSDKAADEFICGLKGGETAYGAGRDG